MLLYKSSVSIASDGPIWALVGFGEHSQFLNGC